MKGEAGVCTCPLCGGPNPPNVRHCAYCSAPICTVRCARCYHMNWPRAQNCSGCGYALGLEPVSLPEGIGCIECHGAMKGFSGHPGMLYDCADCGSQFVEHILLRDLLEQRAVYGARIPSRSEKWNPLERPVVYLKCPVCRESMLRYNFGGTSGIVIDSCGSHGTWFHSGELPRVLAFVEAGGLQEAKRRELGLPPVLSPEHRRRLGTSLLEAQKESNYDSSGRELPDASRGTEIDWFDFGSGVLRVSLGLLRSLGRWMGG